MTTGLIVINEFDEYRQDLVLMAEKADFVPDTSTKEGYDKSKRLALDIAKVRIGLEKARKAKKQFHLEGGRAVDTEAKELLEKILAFETPHLNAYKKIDNERKAKQEKLLEDVQDLIRLGSTARLCGWDSAKIKACVENLNKQAFVEFDEQQENAEMARDNSVSSLNELYVVVLKKETDAIELAKFQAEAEAKAKVEYEEKLKAEARKTAEEAQAKAEAEKVEADKARKLAVKNAEIAREAEIAAKKLAARQAKEAEEEAKALAIRQAKERKDAEEFAEAENERARQKAVKQVEADKKEASKQAEIDKAEAARIAREEEVTATKLRQEAIEAEANKRELDHEHNKKINNEVLSALVKIATIDKDQAKLVILSIVRGEIPHVKLSY